MKTKRLMLKGISYTLTIMITFSLGVGDVSYAFMEDRTDRLSDRSGVFSPGYINAANYKTQEVINQADNNKKKGFMESVIAYVQNKLSDRVIDQSTDKRSEERRVGK